MASWQEVLSLPGKGRLVLNIVLSEFVMGSIMIALRIFTNTIILKSWKTSFWLALAAYLTGSVAVIFCTIAITYGIGAHEVDLIKIDPDFIVKAMFFTWVATNFAIASVAFGKNAIIAFILEILGAAASRWQKWMLCGLATVNFVVSFAGILIIWTRCTPAARLWDFTIRGICDMPPYTVYAYASGGFGAIVDAVLTFYPIWVFWNLKVPIRKKLGLMSLFLVGVVAFIATVVKTSKLHYLSEDADYTYEFRYLVIWTSTEMWTVIMISCIPAVRAIWANFRNKELPAHIAPPAPMKRKPQYSTFYAGMALTMAEAMYMNSNDIRMAHLKQMSAERIAESNEPTLYQGGCFLKNASTSHSPLQSDDSDTNLENTPPRRYQHGSHDTIAPGVERVAGEIA